MRHLCCKSVLLYFLHYLTSEKHTYCFTEYEIPFSLHSWWFCLGISLMQEQNCGIAARDVPIGHMGVSLISLSYEFKVKLPAM